MQTLFQLTQKEYDALCKKHFPFADYEKKLSECFEMIEKLNVRIEQLQKEINESKTARSFVPQATSAVLPHPTEITEINVKIE